MLQMTSHPLGNVFEAVMEKRQDQIPDEGFLIKKRKQYMTLFKSEKILKSTKKNLNNRLKNMQSKTVIIFLNFMSPLFYVLSGMLLLRQENEYYSKYS